MMYESRDVPSTIETKDDIQQRITSPPQIMRVQSNHIFSMNHHAHRVYHQHPHPYDIEAYGMMSVPTGQDELPSHMLQVSPSVILTNDKQPIPNNVSSLTETCQYYYNVDMDGDPLKQAQNRIKDADQMAKTSPLILPVVCVTTVMVFVIGLFVLYQVHSSSDVEE